MNSTNGGVKVTTELGLNLLVPQQFPVPLAATVMYWSGDPYIMRMAFHVGTSRPVEWVFARDLMAAGLTELVGIDGDVQFWPDLHDTDLMHMVVSSPFGRAHFELSLSDTAEFLDQTYRAVPPGHEGDFVNIADELDNFNWGTGLSVRPSTNTGRPRARCEGGRRLLCQPALQSHPL